ncbi:MAG: hypothetical protein COS71_02260 [Candidatus Moranbacteria bacterium CG06_land_8_20_14_3_00_40_12]|nr:MAG: hypothetical protein COX31_00960 [Candidatus Moranbacteria bacterium CG23_combo_of_CG06-09_8_20_14_all_40_16]PIU80658.1 MAG: hypothetical protein COS71_02260 [Candidatus Moranbacteria bacterium CG06_land_8_20_14_3_00_40_12]
MTNKAKLIKTIYLYLIAAVSLLFVAIGAGTLLNTGLKYYIFPAAEKRSYYECNQQPPISPVISKEGTTEVQKTQIDELLKDYENWKENQSGDKCINPTRQNKIIDALTMIIIALPILLIHWKLIRKGKEEEGPK